MWQCDFGTLKSRQIHIFNKSPNINPANICSKTVYHEYRKYKGVAWYKHSYLKASFIVPFTHPLVHSASYELSPYRVFQVIYYELHHYNEAIYVPILSVRLYDTVWSHICVLIMNLCCQWIFCAKWIIGTRHVRIIISTRIIVCPISCNTSIIIIVVNHLPAIVIVTVRPVHRMASTVPSNLNYSIYIHVCIMPETVTRLH